MHQAQIAEHTAHEGCASHKDTLKLECEKLTTIQRALNPKIPAKGIKQLFTSQYFFLLSREFNNFEPLLDLLGQLM